MTIAAFIFRTKITTLMRSKKIENMLRGSCSRNEARKLSLNIQEMVKMLFFLFIH